MCFVRVELDYEGDDLDIELAIEAMYDHVHEAELLGDSTEDSSAGAIRHGSMYLVSLADLSDLGN